MLSKQELIKWGLIIVIAFVAITVLAFFLGRGCAPKPVILKEVPIDVDTSQVDTEANEQLTKAEKEAERKIQELEKEHRKDLEKFTKDQELEYNQIREKGPDAVVDWLRDFNETLKGR